jgi:hypothetical protein
MVYRTALFWVITQQVVVIRYRRFGKPIGFHLQGSWSHILRGGSLKWRSVFQFPTERLWSCEYIRHKRKHKASCMTSLFQDGKCWRHEREPSSCREDNIENGFVMQQGRANIWHVVKFPETPAFVRVCMCVCTSMCVTVNSFKTTNDCPITDESLRGKISTHVCFSNLPHHS